MTDFRAPLTIKETGLKEPLLINLLLKHFLVTGNLNILDAAEKLGLTGTLTEQLILRARKQKLLQVIEGRHDSITFGLTEAGRVEAANAKAQDGYVGPAPISLEQYKVLVERQSVKNSPITRPRVSACYKDVVVDPKLIDTLGPAVISGKSLFIYGPSGTGKTYLTQKLGSLFEDSIQIPHSIAIEDYILPIFDPAVHKEIAHTNTGTGILSNRQDGRLKRCLRPQIIVGGEMTIEMLDVRFDAQNNVHQVPLQLKANNGIFIIDDMGRQKSSPADIFNRWIVPMEESIDYLTIGSGHHFSTPFDQLLVFSSNINPLSLADEAFLRRIGYKVKFDFLEEKQYRKIWENECAAINIEHSTEVLDYVINELHRKRETPLLPCHPRDLLSIAKDQAAYLEDPIVLTTERIHWSWNNYFVSLNDQQPIPVLKGAV